MSCYTCGGEHVSVACPVVRAHAHPERHRPCAWCRKSLDKADDHLCAACRAKRTGPTGKWPVDPHDPTSCTRCGETMKARTIIDGKWVCLECKKPEE